MHVGTRNPKTSGGRKVRKTCQFWGCNLATVVSCHGFIWIVRCTVLCQGRLEIYNSRAEEITNETARWWFQVSFFEVGFGPIGWLEDCGAGVVAASYAPGYVGRHKEPGLAFEDFEFWLASWWLSHRIQKHLVFEVPKKCWILNTSATRSTREVGMCHAWVRIFPASEI